MNKEKIVAVAVAILVAYTVTLSLLNPASSPLYSESEISSGGTVKGIGVAVYSNAACTSKLSSIDWGMLEPGENESVTAYIRNEGNYVITISLSTENWSPSSASQYITLSWDYDGQSVNPDEVVEVTFTLAVSSSIDDITDFSFDIIIVGSG